MMGTEQTRVPTGRVPRGVGAVLDDFGAELVPEDAVGRRVQGGDADGVHQPGEVAEVRQRVQVGPADAGGQRAHHDVARGRHGVRDVAHDQPATPRHRRTHA